MSDAIIIGGGLFGSVLAHALFKEGRTVTVIDDDRPDSGSKPSGGLMKPSWFGGLGRQIHEPAIKLLDRVFGVEELIFDIYVTDLRIHKEKVFRVSPAKTRQLPPRIAFKGKATAVGEGWVQIENGPRLEAPLVVVAAGIWCKELLECDVKPLRGVSFQFPGIMERGRIRIWAPYKQLVLHQEGPGIIWGGDGSAIKPENWKKTRNEECLKRVQSLLPDPTTAPMSVRTGLRPYTHGIKPCLFEKRGKGLYLITGGAKNGMIGAGWCASRILEETA